MSATVKGVRTFWLPRRGHSPAEYEDALAVNEAAGRFAVADGASESCFTGLWARLLVEDFAARAECPIDQWPEALPALQEKWDADVRGRTLPWYAEPGVRQGAFATFLGLVLTDGPGDCPDFRAAQPGDCPDFRAGDCPDFRAAKMGLSPSPSRWHAVAVGDTCLFHTRGADLLRAFPLDHSDQFNNAPKLVGSRMPVEDIRKRQSLWTEGRGRPDDRLWIMTDALAQWCLAEHETGGNPSSELESLLALPEEGDGFASWIDKLRDAGRLRNDDVTLLAIKLSAK